MAFLTSPYSKRAIGQKYGELVGLGRKTATAQVFFIGEWFNMIVKLHAGFNNYNRKHLCSTDSKILVLFVSCNELFINYNTS